MSQTPYITDKGQSAEGASLRDEIASCWLPAQARWSRFLLLNDPIVNDQIASIAQIELATRQITLNGILIGQHGLYDCVEG